MQSNWFQTLEYSFQSVWVEVVRALPGIVLAIVILVIGFIVASTLKRAVHSILNKLKVNEALNAAGVGAVVERSGYRLDAGLVMGTLVKWFVVLVFFVAALDVLNLQQATSFISEIVLGYLPKVIVATIIVFAGIIIAGIVNDVVAGAARAAHFKSPEFLGKFAKFAVLTFAALAALNQLHIAAELVQMLFAGMVFAISLALGLAFGLGGRETAAKYLDSMTNNRS